MPAELPVESGQATKKGSPRKKGASGGGLLMLLFSATIFISAALLFLVEPMFAKFILPLFGSTPAVWTGSMLFFQATLLLAYLYVHATTTWLGARKQAWLHLAVVSLPLILFLLSGPLAVPSEGWAPSSQSNPIFLLLGLMLVAVGLPFFAIAATNPLIQRWLADTDHPAARDPYFLYRASNLGSVVGLLGYPLVVERRLRWIGLAFIPSSLMLGVTAFITTDITPVPLLWVIPLSLYLFSFVVVFSRSQKVPSLIHRAMVAALPVTLSLLVVA